MECVQSVCVCGWGSVCESSVFMKVSGVVSAGMKVYNSVRGVWVCWLWTRCYRIVFGVTMWVGVFTGDDTCRGIV